MAVELVTEIIKQTEQFQARIEHGKTYNASEPEITGYYTGLGENALMMGGGFYGKDNKPQITQLGESVTTSDPQSKIAVAVAKAVAANKASYSLHCAMDGGSETFGLIKYASFDKARKRIEENLGRELINIFIELKNAGTGS
jgi:hypothetical protein